MSNKYRFQLTAKKYNCPKCGQRRFSRLYDTEEKKLLPEKYGRCNRENSCGYILHAGSEFYDGIRRTIPPEIVAKSAELSRYRGNNFACFLESLFGEYSHTLLKQYRVGTSKNGRAVFWYVDYEGAVRSGKIVDYDRTGHRVKTSHTTWVHSAMYSSDEYEYKGVLFGEHLLSDSSQPVAIVESEKTAIVGAGYCPDEFIWCAVGGGNGLGGKKTGLNEYRVRHLVGRKVVLFPDLDNHNEHFELWGFFAQQMRSIGIDARIDTGFAKYATATSRDRGEDIADFMIRQYEDGHIIFPHLISQDVNSKLYLPF